MAPLFWKKGLSWKVRQISYVPSMAAVLDPPDEKVEDLITYKVVDEDNATWTVSVTGLGRWELCFFKEPMALKSVTHIYTTAHSDKEMHDTVVELDAPADYLHGMLMSNIPFIIDFPVLGEILGDRTLTDGKGQVNTVLCFEPGRPFWTHAKRTYGERTDMEAWLRQ